jgi:hypothetical protein
MSYKRSQLEAAGSNEPASELRTRIKAPGTGADISFSEYEAFTLLNALRIMEHGWPQSFAVSIMRRVRPDLMKEHGKSASVPPFKRPWMLISVSNRG